jgi:hypothetical protein
MARKKTKKTIRNLKRKGKVAGHGLMPLVAGAILGNVANNMIIKFAGNVLPMPQTLSPLAIGLLAYYMKSDYSNGIIASSAINMLSGISKQYMPDGQLAQYLAGEDQYIIQGQESNDPLMGADYLYGEMDNSDMMGADEFVVSGASNDPLD